MAADGIAVGSLLVQRIEESQGPGFPPSGLLPDQPAEALRADRDRTGGAVTLAMRALARFA